MPPALRIAVASMTLSAAGMGGLVVDENYRAEAYIPVAGDRWTYGMGSTFKFDGSPVQKGDTITVVDAVRLKLKHIAVDETAVRKCVTAPLTQGEYDTLLSHAYQYGHRATCTSTLVKLINEGQYAQACQQYARWTKVAGRDCRNPANGCTGVALRADRRVAQCLAAQAIPSPVAEPAKPLEPIDAVAPPSLWPKGLAVSLLLSLVLAGYVFWRNRK